MSVVAALERELAELGVDAESSTLAASALALARELDGGNSATSKSMCAKALLDVMNRLRELVPVEAEFDRVDEVAARRVGRRAKATG